MMRKINKLQQLSSKLISFIREEEVIPMLYVDKYGNLMQPEEVDALPSYEIEERFIHPFEGDTGTSA